VFSAWFAGHKTASGQLPVPWTTCAISIAGIYVGLSWTRPLDRLFAVLLVFM
jgi:hypothetical protein